MNLEVTMVWERKSIKNTHFKSQACSSICFLIICQLLSLFVINSPSIADQTDLANDGDAKIALNSYNDKLSSVRENAQSIREKVSAARKRERLALAQLQRTQRELYRVQSTYISSQKRLSSIKRDLEVSTTEIQKINNQVKEQSVSLREHLRHIYIYKADLLSSITESLLRSEGIVKFLNAIYFQRKVVQNELGYINNIKKKQDNLRALQRHWQEKTESLSSTMEESEKLREVISQKKDEQYGLVDRLRKERLAYESAERQLERESNELTQKILSLTDGQGIGLEELIKGSFYFPVRAAITSPFGYRMHPIFRVRSFHSGVDLGAKNGTPIKAANGGLVIYAGWYSGYGKTVIVSHSGGKSTLYAHMSRIDAKAGDKVAQGQTIGYVGSSGYSTGPHLHFEYRLGGKPQNPLAVLR